MTELAMPLGTIKGNIRPADKVLTIDEIKWRATAMLGFAGGFSFLAIGLLISLLGRFFESGLTALEMNRFGTVLLIPAFPLMFLGAHALDKIHEAKRKRAISRTAHRQVQ